MTSILIHTVESKSPQLTPEDGQEFAELAADKPAADETEKEDELVAAANVIDQVVVRAIMDRESISTDERTRQS